MLHDDKPLDLDAMEAHIIEYIGYGECAISGCKIGGYMRALIARVRELEKRNRALEPWVDRAQDDEEEIAHLSEGLEKFLRDYHYDGDSLTTIRQNEDRIVKWIEKDTARDAARKAGTNDG